MRNAHRYVVEAVFTEDSINPYINPELAEDNVNPEANTGLDKDGNPIKKAVISSVTENEVTITITDPVWGEEFHLSIAIYGFMEGMIPRPMSTYNDLPVIEARYFDTTLESLAVDETRGSLTEAFAPDKRSYTLGVVETFEDLEITATVSDYKLSEISINDEKADSGVPQLVTVKGKNTITITVTADCGLTGDYILNIEKLDLLPDPIRFTDSSLAKTYGDSAFTNPLDGTHKGTGPITYSSSNPAAAAVNSNGEVTIVSAGTATITAEKEKDDYYLGSSAVYTLTVSPKELSIQSITHTKPYDGNTAVTGNLVGTFNGFVNGDSNADITIESYIANYTNAAAGTATMTISAITLGGAKGGNYTAAPTTVTATPGIVMAQGADVSAPTLVSRTQNSITVKMNPIPANGQSIEYAYNTTGAVPDGTWTAGTGADFENTFTTLTPATVYYLFARSAENANYSAGTPSAALQTSTPGVGTFEVIFNEVSGSEPEPTVSVSASISRTGIGGTLLSITLNAPPGYDSYTWVYNGVTDPAPLGTTQTVTLYGYNYVVYNNADTQHSYTLIVTKGAESYSCKVEFTVVP